MGLIKRNRIEDKGVIALEEKKLEIFPQAEEAVLEGEGGEVSAAPLRSEADILREAQATARGLVEEARREAARSKEQIRSEARKEGLEQGKKEGRLELQARVEEALEVINQAVKEREKIIKDAESEILRLSLKIAEQIIRSEVSLHRDVCLNIVSEAIQRVSDREQVIIRVNREDLEQVKKYKDRIAGLVDGVKSFSILEDSHVEPGGCMIETNLGFVDARISTKLAAIEEAFKRAEKEE